MVGSVRSGSIAPSLGNKNIATALVAPEAAAVGTRVEVEIRGKNHAADVVAALDLPGVAHASLDRPVVAPTPRKHQSDL